ncbi:unnamed protein product [Rotaria sordida]|uniref:G-protein coupled receptors family 1 profile domain-containing protein n=1 Tax=Rotaria sordida TaxID=392033 RepID=A0A819XIN5_9BILA|nr:unnamed protein product [Rotaria sordida]CAF4143098.1 unnamed protein product [Rotaria sordida]
MSTNFAIIERQIITYCGIPIFVAGVIGGILNIIVFLSLRTFRQSSCGLYLIVMSIFNIGHLFLALFYRILTILSGVDVAATSLFICKLRSFLAQICSATSMTCFCMATIDQYFATCSRVRWQLWCNIKLSQRIIIISIIIWILHGIPFLVFYNHVLSSITNKITCISTNYIFDQYRIFVFALGLVGYLAIIIGALFGSMAFYNVQQMAYRAVPLVRRELEKQLTVMVLVEVVVNILALLPYTTINAVSQNKNLTNNSFIQAQIQFASPFYVYICASERFRKQLIYVLFEIHLNRWRRPRMIINQVIPDT